MSHFRLDTYVNIGVTIGGVALGDKNADGFAQKCKDAGSVDDLRRAIFERDPLALTAKDVVLADRASKRIGVIADIRFAFAGTHSVDPLPAYLKVHGLAHGYAIGTFVAPYGQYMQQLLAADSAMARFDPGLLFLSCALRQVAPRIYYEFSSLPPAIVDSERERLLDHVCEAAEHASKRTSATILIANFERPPYPALGIADAKRESGETEFYLSLNLELLRRFKSSDRVHVVDMDRLIGGTRADSADRMYFVAKNVWPESACNVIAQELLRYIVAVTGRTKKCLVVDLDNTLWGGVIGEDGATGISVGPGSPVGEAFQNFQYAIRSLRERGIILAICSKNNPADAEDAFRVRSDMPLKLQDFSASEISWGDKASGLRGIAATLNLGTEGFVFVDDNPAERAVTRGALPETTVPELPRDPAEFTRFLQRQVYFEKLRINSDDIVRLRDYEARGQREQLHATSGTLVQYLAGLRTEIEVRPAGQADVTRVHELFNKTNQFNLTTRRYTVADVQRFIAQPQFSLGVVTASDAFGPMGTIGVYLLESADGVTRLDSLLLSCRALGRGIGTALMNWVKNDVVRRLGCTRIIAEFVPTAKNAPANGYLAEQGFDLVTRREDGLELYEASGSGLQLQPCEHVRVVRGLDGAVGVV